MPHPKDYREWVNLNYATVRGRVYHWLRRIGNASPDGWADEGVQHAFCKALEKMRDHPVSSLPKTLPWYGTSLGWLVTVAKNHVRDQLRKKRPQSLPPVDPAAPSGAPPREDVKTLSAYENCLRQLSSQELQILIIWYRDGRTDEEIGLQLFSTDPATPGALGQRARRLRKCAETHLRQVLLAAGFEPDILRALVGGVRLPE
jgi:DNA-directed RNA polymerase specialized sigma24 family protein